MADVKKLSALFLHAKLTQRNKKVIMEIVKCTPDPNNPPKFTKETHILKNFQEIKTLIVLAIITFIAHFWYFYKFGIYEVDYVRIPDAMTMTGSELIDYLVNLWFDFGGDFIEGRPLHPAFIYLFSFLGEQLGGLFAVHLIGYVLVTINVILFYLFLQKIWSNQIFVLTGALTFSLFPLYVTRIWLTSSLGHQPSLTFVLLALICYISGRKKLSYLLVIGSLLCYETFFPLFWTAPLFNQKWSKKMLQELLIHTLILGALVFSLVVVRKLAGESRLTDLNFWSTILLIAKNIFIGSVMSMKMFFSRSLTPLQNFNRELGIFMFIGLTAIIWLMSDKNLEKNDKNLINFWSDLTKLAIIGLIMLALSYSLTLTLPIQDYSFYGDESRIHISASIGVSILFGCLCSALWHIAKVYRQKRLVTVLIATFFSLLIGFNMIVQQNYVTLWQYQKAFWQDVLNLAPDMTEETLILVDGLDYFKRPEYVTQENWSGPFALHKIYQFPDQWEFPPSLHKLFSNWREQIVVNQNSLQLKELSTVQVATRIGYDRQRQFNFDNIIFLDFYTII